MRYIILFFLLFFLSTNSNSFENPKINLGNFLINKYEVTIKEFSDYAERNNIKTMAELKGGGYQWGAGWEKKAGWNYRAPYGKKPQSHLEPVTHINRFEAENYCIFKGGRLPNFEEWKLAAYTQILKSKKFSQGRTYDYPSGDKAVGLNSQGILGFNKHVEVTSLPDGINGLVAMGGNVWEWISDTKGKSSLTAGASWWYGASKTQVSGVQYKPSNFYVIYVGFRCAFDN